MLAYRGTLVAYTTLQQILAYRSTIKYGIVCFSMGSNPFFCILSDPNMLGAIDPTLCLCEMVLGNTARPFIDFDKDVGNSITQIETVIKEYILKLYGYEVSLTWRFSQHYTKTWHCIISGIFFKECWKEESLKLADYLSNQLGDLGIDRGVYRTNSTLRMLYQCKYVDYCYSKQLLPYAAYNILDSLHTQSPNDRQIKVDTPPVKVTVLSTRCVLANTSFQVPYGYAIEKKIAENIIRLVRVQTSWCELCSRLHDSENAYIILKENSIELRCFRQKYGEGYNGISKIYPLQTSNNDVA